MTREEKKKILKEFSIKMENIYDFCTTLDSDDRLIVGKFSIEPETQMEMMANEALEDILDDIIEGKIE